MKRGRSTSKAPKRQKTMVIRQPTGSLSMRSNIFASRNVGMGSSAKTVLRTSFFANLTAAGTGIFTGYLKPGSCFDPCGDIAAIQPVLFDQFAAVFQRYKVDSAEINIKILGKTGGADGVYSYVAAAYPAIDPTALATYQGAASQPWGQARLGNFASGSAAAVAIGMGSTWTSMKFKLVHDSVVGSKSDSYDSGALVTADPTAAQYMVMPVFIQSNAAAASTFTIHVDMFQHVTFSQRKILVDA